VRLPVQSLSAPAPPFRILNPLEAEELVLHRGAWAELWQAIAREADAADETPPDDEAET
jgi:hypothetical protein